MRYFQTGFAVVMLLLMAGSAAAQQDMTWDTKQQLYYAFRDPMCNLSVDTAWHPGKDQPIHIKVTNYAHTALQYRLSLTVIKGKESLGTVNATADVVKAGDKTELVSSPFRGSAAGSQLMIQVTACTAHH